MTRGTMSTVEYPDSLEPPVVEEIEGVTYYLVEPEISEVMTVLNIPSNEEAEKKNIRLKKLPFLKKLAPESQGEDDAVVGQILRDLNPAINLKQPLFDPLPPRICAKDLGWRTWTPEEEAKLPMEPISLEEKIAKIHSKDKAKGKKGKKGKKKKEEIG